MNGNLEQGHAHGKTWHCVNHIHCLGMRGRGQHGPCLKTLSMVEVTMEEEQVRSIVCMHCLSKHKVRAPSAPARHVALRITQGMAASPDSTALFPIGALGWLR